MSSGYDEDDELAQWAGGYVNAEGSINLSPALSTNSRIGYGIEQQFYCNATYPTTPEMAGLVDGEGTIDVQMRFSSNSKINHAINAKFQVSMATEFDIERLAMWIRSLEITPKTTTTERENKDYEDKYIVYVSDRDDFKELIEELFPYLSRSKSIQAYIALKEVIPRMKEGVHHDKRGYMETVSWIDLQRTYKGAREIDTKYTLEYFQEEWPNVEPRESHLAPSKEEFEEQLFGEQERETFEDTKTIPSPRSPSDDYDPEEDDPFDF